MSFNIVIDSKTAKRWSDGILSSELPETLFFSSGEKWEVALLDAWFSKGALPDPIPIYINTPVIEAQIVGGNWRKNLSVIYPHTGNEGTICYLPTHAQYKNIFRSHVSQIDFYFYDSMNKPFQFVSDSHVILRLDVRIKPTF